MGYNVESLQQLTAMTSDSIPNAIQNGRNVRAGYVRGVGLEWKGLFDLCHHDPMFQRAFAATQNRSIIPIKILANIMLMLRFGPIDRTKNIIEFGSYRGGSALFMAAIARLSGYSCKIFALDTFSGMPPADGILDDHKEGDFADTDYQSLIKARNDLGLDNLVILRGLFQDTVHQIPEAERSFCLAHIDCDIYSSMVFSINWSKPHMDKGGYIVCDDPLTSMCLGAMQAVEETLVRCGASAEQVFPHLVYRWPPL
jgi:Macrocin-O-methyltransferase (TylF)